MRNYGRDIEKPCLDASTSNSKCKRNSDSEEYNEDERFNPSKPYNPGPLKLEIKSIKNSTRTDSTYSPVDMNDLLNEGSGRSFLTVAVLVSGIVVWCFKSFWKFIAIHGIDYAWSKIKYLLGYSDDYFETYITVGHDGHKHHRHDLKHKKHHHHHHHDHDHHGWEKPHHDGWGWKPSHHHKGHHHSHRYTHYIAPIGHHLYHPSQKLFEQPTIQYLPHGKEYPLHGFDQRQALKYKDKYNQKFTKYKRKYYRKKGKEIIKANRKKQKAIRKKQKALKRKKKVKAFRERLKEWFNVKDKGDNVDESDEEENDLGEKNWRKSSSEMEDGKPPQRYQPGQEDYDPLPNAGKHQQFLRISK